MVRPVAPTPASEEEEFTPLEDILRPVSATMVEPLDLPNDRFVPLEDILYAAGSAFARPSPELEEYYATARKREAEAAQPEMSDEVRVAENHHAQTPNTQSDIPNNNVASSSARNEHTNAPTYNDLHRQYVKDLPEWAKDPNLRREMNRAFTDSNSGLPKGNAQGNDFWPQKEQGGYIIDRGPLAEKFGMDRYILDRQPGGGIDGQIMLDKPGFRIWGEVIADFHTHPTKPGIPRKVGPSDTDISTMNSANRPMLIQDQYGLHYYEPNKPEN